MKETICGTHHTDQCADCRKRIDEKSARTETIEIIGVVEPYGVVRADLKIGESIEGETKLTHEEHQHGILGILSIEGAQRHLPLCKFIVEHANLLHWHAELLDEVSDNTHRVSSNEHEIKRREVFLQLLLAYRSFCRHTLDNLITVPRYVEVRSDPILMLLIFSAEPVDQCSLVHVFLFSPFGRRSCVTGTSSISSRV